MLKICFWMLAALVGYTYLGYGAIIGLLARVIPHPVMHDGQTRPVTLLIAAYNEADIIDAKIQNALALDYPRDRLEIVVVTDGSTDRTPEIVAEYRAQAVVCYHCPERRGKMAALKRVLPLTGGEIVVFSDANTLYNPAALHAIVAPFADPQVGCVAGEKRVLVPGAGEQGMVSGEGLYWKYESFLKRMDSRVYSVVGAAGELYAVRRSLLELPPDNSLIDDFMVSMLVARKGYRIIYEPRAQANETEPPGLGDEFERRCRISCGGFQSIWWLRGLLSPRYGLLWFQYVSHRVMRWAVAPPALPLLLLLNLALARSPLYRVLLGLQAVFYVAAGAGLLLAQRGRRIKALFVPGYFVMMNGAALVGFYRYITRSQQITWKKAARRSTVPIK